VRTASDLTSLRRSTAIAGAAGTDEQGMRWGSPGKSRGRADEVGWGDFRAISQGTRGTEIGFQQMGRPSDFDDK
jgi:hypothetical protein